MSYTKLRQTLAASLATAYQLPEDDIATILPEKEEDFKEEDFTTKFLDLDKERIQTINQKGKEKFEQGYSKAKKEERINFEKEIKEHFNIEDSEDLIGIDLVKKVAELNAGKSKSDPTKLTEDELKSHPLVIKMLSDKEKTFKETEKKLKDEFDLQMKTINKKEVFNKASKKALAILDSMNPVLSADPVKAQNQRNILIKEIEGFEYQEEGDDFIPLKDGKRVENDHGHGVTFESLVKDKAQIYFDFKKADDRSNPPADPGGQGSKNPMKPTNEQEYAKVMTDKSIPLEDRLKIKEEWNSKQ